MSVPQMRFVAKSKRNITMTKWVFINDGFEKEEKAFLHFRDLSFQRGYGVFDFFRLQENKPLFLEDHLDRFWSSAQHMHLQIPFDRPALKEIITQLIEKNNFPNSGIRMSLTGGYSGDDFALGKSNIIVSQHSFSEPSQAQQEAGVALLSYSHQRQLPQVKTIDYLMAIWLQPLRTQNGADDVLYHTNGYITECPRSNFFLVTQENRIVTPNESILKGITRSKVIELANETFRVEERPVHLDELNTAKEAFITSTTKRILPVRQIDKKVFGERKVSSKLLQRFYRLYNH